MQLRLSREPALLLIGVIAPVAQLVLSYTPWPLQVVTALDALAVTVAGLLTAVLLRSEQMLPAVIGVVQAVLVVALALGVPIDPTQRALVMTIVGIVAAAFVRQNVEARTPAAAVAA